MTPVEWKRKYSGTPNAVNLTEFVAKYNESFAPGGCNHYPIEGENPRVIVAAKVVRVATGEVLAEWAPDGNDPEKFAAFTVEGI